MLEWEVAAEDGRALRDDIGEWLIPDEDWSKVAGLVDDAIGAAQHGNLDAVSQAVAWLELLSPLAAPRPLHLRRAPAPVLERVDTLVHVLDQAAAEQDAAQRSSGAGRRRRWWHVRR